MPYKELNDQYGYRRVPARQDTAAVRIAFFAGSTGYHGHVNLVDELERQMITKLGRRVQFANFSVISANHRQHLHDIIESHSLFAPDIVIFYGGINETTQHINFDPRPGYPYNFYYRHETNDWARILLKSPFFYTMNRYDLIPLTNLQDLRKTWPVYSEVWTEGIKHTYFQTLQLAQRVTGAFDSAKCGGKSKFIFFFQPSYVPVEFRQIQADLRKEVALYSYGYDISEIFGHVPDLRTVLPDGLHPTDEANRVIAERISDLLLSRDDLAGCWNNAAKIPAPRVPAAK